MACFRCDGTGLMTIDLLDAEGYARRVMGICPDCDTGNTLYRFLAAVAKGEPVFIRSIDTVGFAMSGQTLGPCAVLTPPIAGDFLPVPKEG